MATTQAKSGKIGNDYDLDLFLQEAVDVAQIAGKVIREAIETDKNIQTKECATDIVTETDIQCERIIFEHFKKKFPTHSFIGEESVAAGEKCDLTDNPTWIIDPIDGTTNFVHKFPFVAVSIGLAIEKELVVGVIYNPILDEMHTGVVGKGAMCNGKPIKVSGETEINKALLMSEVGASREKSRVETIVNNMKKVISEPYMAHSIRSLGSAALNMCCIARGQADGYFEFGIHCWDIAAGIVIIQEAGGVCTSPTGGPVDIMSRQMICASTETLAKSICNIVTAIPHIRD